jgi:PPM family protein phosphatase
MKMRVNNPKPASVSKRWQAAALSDTGRVRQQNEDAYTLLPEQGLFIVSDGMGGRNAGETASRTVVEVFPEILASRLNSIPDADIETLTLLLRDAIVDLSQYVRRLALGHAELTGMGATLVLALGWRDQLIIANMGDSRAYLCSEGKLRQLTDDHSIVGMLLQDGELTPEEVKNHPARGIVSRYVGMEGVVYPDVKSIIASNGDWLLLCTDGLTSMISDQAISDILSRHAQPEEACKSLIEAANEIGGRDNITVLIVDLT